MSEKPRLLRSTQNGTRNSIRVITNSQDVLYTVYRRTQEEICDSCKFASSPPDALTVPNQPGAGTNNLHSTMVRLNTEREKNAAT